MASTLNQTDLSASSSSIQKVRGEPQTENFTFMEPEVFVAAAAGKFGILLKYTDRVDRLLTPTRNTVLHVYITALPEKVEEPNDMFLKAIQLLLSAPRICEKLFSKLLARFFAEDVQQLLSVEIPEDLSLVTILKKYPSLLLQRNAKGETPLHLAARYGHFEVVEKFITSAESSQEDIERGTGMAREMLRMTNNHKDTALHEAVRHNHAEVVKKIIGYDPDFTYTANDSGESPVYIAAERGFSNLVAQILATCKGVFYGGPNGRTALHAAVYCDNEEMTRMILNKARDLTKEADEQGQIPLHHAAHFGYLSIVKLLMQFDKLSAYIGDNKKRTALHVAAGRGNVAVMKEIMSCCPDCCEMIDQRGWNVLHFAMTSHNKDAVHYLHQNLCLSNLINEKDSKGNAPLHNLAISLCKRTSFPNNNRVDKMAMNKENMTALDIAIQNNDFPENKMNVIRQFKRAGLRLGWKNLINVSHYAENEEESSLNDDHVDENGNIKQLDEMKQKEKRNTSTSRGDKLLDQLQEARNIHLVVATLIATVTFAAGFTMPGGYKGDDSSDPGRAILTRNAAFAVFVISDTIAMVLSSCAVLIHLFMAIIDDETWLFRHVISAFMFTFFSMLAMGVAFVSGTYAVLGNQTAIAIVTCVLGSLFFPFYCVFSVKALLFFGNVEV